MAITYEFWVRNLIEAAADISNAERQAQRWIAPDAAAWERPAELLCVLLDDMNFELFIEQNPERLSEVQLRAATEFAQAALSFDCGPDGWRDPHDVLRDPAWEGVQMKGRAFESAFVRELGQSSERR